MELTVGALDGILTLKSGSVESSDGVVIVAMMVGISGRTVVVTVETEVVAIVDTGGDTVREAEVEAVLGRLEDLEEDVEVSTVVFPAVVPPLYT